MLFSHMILHIIVGSLKLQPVLIPSTDTKFILQIYFPIECHMVAKGITRKQQKWWWLQALSLFTLLITIVSAIGSVEYVVQDLKVWSASTWTAVIGQAQQHSWCSNYCNNISCGCLLISDKSISGHLRLGLMHIELQLVARMAS